VDSGTARALSSAGASGVVGADGVRFRAPPYSSGTSTGSPPRGTEDARARGWTSRAWAQIATRNRRVRRRSSSTSVTRRLRRLSVSSTTTPGPRSRRLGCACSRWNWAWWDVDSAVGEIERMRTLGLRGGTPRPRPHPPPPPPHSRTARIRGRALRGTDVGGREQPRAAGNVPHRRPGSRRSRGIRLGCLAVAQRRPEARPFRWPWLGD